MLNSSGLIVSPALKTTQAGCNARAHSRTAATPGRSQAGGR